MRFRTRGSAGWRPIAVALVCAAVVQGAGVGRAFATHSTVDSVAGSAYGYFSNVSLFGGPFNTRGPTPTVTLAPDASNSPQSATQASGLVQYGPAVLFTSDQIDVSTSGSLGEAGGATSSSTVQNVNKSTTQPELTGSEVFTATTVSSTCTASATGVSGSTFVTEGTLQTSEGDPSVEGDETVVDVPFEPAPNTTYEGQIEGVGDSFRAVFNEQIVNPDGSLTVNAYHLYLLGPTAVGDLIVGQSVCGVTATALPHPADVAVGDITDDSDPVAPLGTVTYTIPVRNTSATESAAGVTLLSTLSGLRGASFGTATVTDGDGTETCTKLKGKTKGMSCDLGVIAPGDTETVTITVTAPRKTGPMTLTSTVSSDSDTNSGNNSASEDTTVARAS